MVASEPLEVRVHGVSGTPPESLLGRLTVYQVGGDPQAGFYRPSLTAEARDTTPGPPFDRAPDGPLLEGYSWGGLTSGSPSRALWLALLPFTLANIAVRTRPEGLDGHPWVVSLLWRVARLVSLCLTGVFVLTAIGIGEAVAGACGSRACGSGLGTSVLGAARDWPAGRQLLLVSVVPLALVLVLWAASSRTFNRYEKVTTVVTGSGGERLPATVVTPRLEEHLDSLGMWRNAREVTRLRARHVQLGLGLVVLSLLWGQGWAVGGAAYLLALAVSVAWSPQPEPTGARARLHLLWWVPAVGGLVLAVVQLWGLEAPQVSARFGEGRAAAYDGLTLLAVVVSAVLVLAYLVANLLAVGLRDRTAADTTPFAAQREPLGGLAGFCLTVIAIFLAAVYSGGFYLYGSAFLTTGSLRPGFRDIGRTGSGVAIAGVIEVGAIAYLIGAALLVVGGIVAGVWVGLRMRPAALERDATLTAQFAADYGAGLDPGDPDARARTAQVKRSLYLGALVDRAPRLFLLLAVGDLVSTLLAMTIVGGHVPVGGPGWLRWLLEHLGDRELMKGLGAYVAVYSLVLLIALGTAAFRVDRTRRLVGIVWDVASFWPRTVHPLAAPCYAERAVPDLVTRTSHLLGEEGRPVVLAAHSQGTVLAAAAIFHLGAVSQVGDDAASRRAHEELRLLTFGCVLRRLYGRYFPVYFGPARMLALLRLLGDDAVVAPDAAAGGGIPEPEPEPVPGPPLPATVRWLNLWRYTDYLGGQMTEGAPQHVVAHVAPEAGPTSVTVGPRPWEWHSPDPASLPRVPGFTTYPTTTGHVDFPDDTSGYFQYAVAELVAGRYPWVVGAAGRAGAEVGGEGP